MGGILRKGGVLRHASPFATSITYKVHLCHACGNALMRDAVFCRKCGTRRCDVKNLQVDIDTGLDKLLTQAEAALDSLSRPSMCCRPFSRRKAYAVLQQVILEMRIVPTKDLLRPTIDMAALQRDGMDEDTSTFLSHLLGFEAARTKGSISPAGNEVGTEKLLPNTPSTTSQSLPLVQRLTENPRYTFAQVTDWANFDIFEAACVIPRGQLFLELFLVADSGFDMVPNSKIKMETLALALNEAQSTYEEPFIGSKRNTYHSALHGAEVLCTAMAMLHKIPRSCVGMRLPALTKLAVMIAALLHDLRHPGLQARFLEAVNHQVCSTYLDDSPLERYHLAEIFRLLNKHGVLGAMGQNDSKRFRGLVSGMVLATDLGQGYKNTSLVKVAFPAIFADAGGEGGGGGGGVSRPRFERSNSISCIENMTSDVDVSPELLNLVVECADVSHPAKPLEFHQRWSVLITHEFLHQGELEVERGLPVSPLCSSSSTMDPASFARSQQGFIDFVVRPKLTVLSKLCGQDGLWMRLLQENHAYWGSATANGFQEVSQHVSNCSAVENGLEAARGSRLRSGTTNQQKTSVELKEVASPQHSLA